jgi:inosine-uridine nucleoside N-ribohydrolase
MIPKNINAKKVIIDFDPGIDDTMALFLALGNNNI